MAFLWLAACSQAEFRPATVAEQFAPFEGEVRMLERLPEASRYQPIGVVTVEGVTYSRESSMVEALKREAAARGANAIVLQSKVKVTKTASGGEQKKLAAWAIRLNE